MVDPKTEAERSAADFAIGFEQDFALHHQQQAFLPATTSPELTVRLDEAYTTYCPEGLQCIVGPSAWPKLAITDAQGQTQEVRLPKNRPSSNRVTWLDTTNIKANGRRYLLTYTRWEIEQTPEKGKMPAKQAWALWFRVAKVNP
ncbi:hypothetical protein [Hymenobacter cellulosilyticus]|uniref:Uncharacterized protein n=1 Tax=Hymenobacter cellulosilyticus TaxID=2932248 RepID=A0A8T9Q6J1_9BACT|nr:hypothetical protein [Hymenobacter cellulosilyticus]UOQ71400.1 hypothetical protein MUN79_22680 [Hymenobacter cellulosilyticus]